MMARELSPAEKQRAIELGQRLALLRRPAEVAPPSPPTSHAPVRMRVRTTLPDPSSPLYRAARLPWIVEHQAKRFRVGVRSVMASENRSPSIVGARHAAIRQMRDEFPTLSACAIARFMGLDHTSVLHTLGRLGRSRRPHVHEPLEPWIAQAREALAKVPVSERKDALDGIASRLGVDPKLILVRCVRRDWCLINRTRRNSQNVPHFD